MQQDVTTTVRWTVGARLRKSLQAYVGIDDREMVSGVARQVARSIHIWGGGPQSLGSELLWLVTLRDERHWDWSRRAKQGAGALCS